MTFDEFYYKTPLLQNPILILLISEMPRGGKVTRNVSMTTGPASGSTPDVSAPANSAPQAPHSERSQTILVPQPLASLDSVATMATDITAASLANHTDATNDVDTFFGSKHKDGSGKMHRTYKICNAKQIAAEAIGELWVAPLGYMFTFSTSSTNLCPHLEHFHKEKYLELIHLKGWGNQLPGAKKEQEAHAAAAAEVPSGTSCAPFTMDGLLDCIVKFIPINVVESQYFCELLLFMCDDIEDHNIPRRTKTRSAVIDTWKKWFEGLKEDFANCLGKKSYTIDLWSAKNRKSYICITAHYLTWQNCETQEGLIFKHAVLAFHEVKGHHTGNNLANLLIKLFERAGITICEGVHFTLNNTINNDTMLRSLYTKLAVRHPDINLGTMENAWICCFLHVVNIITQHLLKALDHRVEGDNDDTTDSDGEDFDDMPL
ncbi:hypothetical protein AX17_004881 [Amanita inopinata Kibby_2008]|nr:hypothetical protein AX17_004881 [Amanita inopinata Kibby_2008]